MNGENGVFVFPDAATGRGTGSIDPGLLALLNQNGGFGNGGNWIWLLFLWMIWGANGNGFGNGFGGNNGTGFLANQLNNDAGRDLLLQAINGRADALGQLANLTHSSIETVKTNLFTLQNAIQQVGNQVGMSGLQTINALQLGNANLSQQLCECCCNMRYDLAQQTNTLQAQAASNHANSQLQASQNFAAQQLQSAQNQAALQLQYAQGQAADQLAVCQQTNQLGSQADRNTNTMLNAIAAQTTTITKEFYDLKERELQNKIDALTADNALLRSNAATTAQTQQFAAMLAPINAELASIKAHQPQTITLPYNQYSVVPTWAANVGADFVASYWASRLNSATQGTTGTTTGGATA